MVDRHRLIRRAMSCRSIYVWRVRLLNPYVAAERGYVDSVIDPAESRREIAAALAMLSNKREKLQPRKHDNTPL